MSLRKQLREKLFELVAEVEHGEAFYEGGRMLDYFCENCDELKRLAQAAYEENLSREDD
jgi:hypothetical protein